MAADPILELHRAAKKAKKVSKGGRITRACQAACASHGGFHHIDSSGQCVCNDGTVTAPIYTALTP